MTDCKTKTIQFQAHNHRKVEADFDGGNITSDAGALLLRQTDGKIKLMERFTACFEDKRDPELIEHTTKDLASQRVYGLCLGYEDLNDHDDIRRDRLLAVLVGKKDIEGKDRRCEADRGIALAGKSTLNRMELIPVIGEAHRYHRIGYDPDCVDELMTDIFLESFYEPPQEIIIDLDTTDDPLHGNQEGRFFHGYYDCYCYTPLYIFCGEHLLVSRLQTSNVDGAIHAVTEVSLLIARIRKRWPLVKIILRGDSGFCRDNLMSWCEENGIFYVFGMSKNDRLLARISKKMAKSRRRYWGNKKATRRYTDLRYRTHDSWRQSRRVVGKVEHLDKGANPRFVVTNLSKKKFNSKVLYEDIYCARGDMENRIKEQQLDMFADRTSTALMRSNQLRLYFSSIAYILMQAFRRLGLKGTEYAKAQCGTIRTKLLKIGAQIKISVRRIFISMASGCPYAKLFSVALNNIQSALIPIRI